MTRNRKSPVAFRLRAKQDNRLYSAYQYAALSASPEDTPTRMNTETLKKKKKTQKGIYNAMVMVMNAVLSSLGRIAVKNFTNIIYK